ncbi:unnamed protein product [Caenorhabditis nigoni]
MKLFSATFLSLFFCIFQTTSSQNTYCIICAEYFNFPETWDDASQLLKFGCSRLKFAEEACNGIVDNANLTDSYPNMYPHIINLKNLVCKKYCPKDTVTP